MKAGRVAAIAIATMAIATPASEAAKKSSSHAIFYKADFGGKQKTLLKENGFRVKSDCEQGSLPSIELRGTGPGVVLRSGLSGSPAAVTQGSSADFGGKIDTFVNGSDTGVGEAVLFQDSKDVVVLDHMTSESAYGKDCTFAGVLTIVGRSERIYKEVTDSSTSVIDNFTDPVVGITCIDDEVAFDATSSGENAFGASQVTFPAPNETALFPLGTTTNVIGPEGSSVLGRMNLVKPAGRVSSVKIGGYAPGAPAGCTAAGRQQSVTKGASRAFYARAASLEEDVKKFFDQSGLALYGSCDNGNLAVYVSTEKKNSLLQTSVQSGTAAITYAETNFDSGAADPYFLFDLDSGHRTGLLIHARPDGHVTALNWAAAASDPGAFKPCIFQGVASSG